MKKKIIIGSIILIIMTMMSLNSYATTKKVDLDPIIIGFDPTKVQAQYIVESNPINPTLFSIVLCICMCVFIFFVVTTIITILSKKSKGKKYNNISLTSGICSIIIFLTIFIFVGGMIILMMAIAYAISAIVFYYIGKHYNVEEKNRKLGLIMGMIVLTIVLIAIVESFVVLLLITK